MASAFAVAVLFAERHVDGQAMLRLLADANDTVVAASDAVVAAASDAVVAAASDPESLGFFDTFYKMYIIPLLVLTIVLGWLARPSTAEVIPEGFRKFQYTYLVVWCICVGADWLQGPYLYALYEAYGYTNNDIALLFVTGFGSSLLFGGMAGMAVDRLGRKKACMVYCITYIMSCVSIHSSNYWFLIFGRITGGIATDLLFSCFECWMVSEHFSRGFSGGLLGYMFGLMFSLMYLVAIVAGFTGEFLKDLFPMTAVGGTSFNVGGYTAPFDLSILCLVTGLILIATLWGENYGDSSGSGSVTDSLSIAWKLLTTDLNMALLAVIVPCFEGSMFAFVFNWTPALSSEIVPPPHGHIFSMFMMTCMCGASTATIIGSSIKLSTRLQITFVAGIVAFFTMSTVAGEEQLLPVLFTAFLLFEFCVGLYFPSIGGLKSDIVPENVRTTVYTCFRIPLNAIVVGLLLSDISHIRCFMLCGVFMVCALTAMFFIRPQKAQEARNIEGGSQSELISQDKK